MNIASLSTRELMVKIESLPANQIAEVHNFVEFLRQRVSPLESVPQERPSSGGNLDFPVVSVGRWPEGLDLRREDLYSDDGR